MTARIYKPARTAMQSGTAKTKEWVLDYEPEQPRTVEPLMGWTSTGDMKQQCGCTSTPRKRPSRIASATASPIRCSRASRRSAQRISYSDNFAYPRRERLDALRAAADARLQAGRFSGLRAASGYCGFCDAARWRSSEMKRSSGIGWPSRKPWP